ncbi:MAG: SMC-Scp complex subunit ScpB [Clostridia bacterium]|nr:SMC-Scp complex subunit ScpB [Clostridia bacterium]
MSQLCNVIESILFISGNAVEISLLAEKLEVSEKEVRNAAEILKERYSGDNGIHLLMFNKKLQFASNPNNAKQVEAVLNSIRERELTNAMLETLAIIAYKQPVTRLEIEEVRGVDCTYSVQNLTKLGMIEAVGRKETIGKPILFATTDEFLKRFSLSQVSDLPDYEVFVQRLKDIFDERASGVVVEKPMFDNSQAEDLPEFLQGENVQVVE